MSIEIVDFKTPSKLKIEVLLFSVLTIMGEP